MTGVKKSASARDARVTRTRSHSRRTHKIQFNEDDQIAVIRTLQPAVLNSKVFRKIYYADVFSIATPTSLAVYARAQVCELHFAKTYIAR